MSCTRQEFNYSCDDDHQFDLILHACIMVGNVFNKNEDDDNGNQNDKMVMMGMMTHMLVPGVGNIGQVESTYCHL